MHYHPHNTYKTRHNPAHSLILQILILTIATGLATKPTPYPKPVA